LGSAAIKHPFHPLHGQSFPILKTRRVGGVDTLTLRGTAGGTFAVPLSWTDHAEPTPWELLDREPPVFAAPFLWELVELIDSLRSAQSEARRREQPSQDAKEAAKEAES
jgi:hypothetical protein